MLTLSTSSVLTTDAQGNKHRPKLCTNLAVNGRGGKWRTMEDNDRSVIDSVWPVC